MANRRAGWHSGKMTASKATVTGGPGISYNIDVDGASVGNAEIRLTNDVVLMTKSGAPSGGTSGDGAGWAGKSSFCFDYSNADAYVNQGSKASPDWKKVGNAT